VDGITYAGNHGLEIMHPDGQMYSHGIPQDYRVRLSSLIKDLEAEAAEVEGAWVEDKGLLVALHYRCEMQICFQFIVLTGVFFY
jgi:alpha,alpha-trehalase